MFRGLIYGSYRKPRELVWIFGCAIFPVPDGRGLHGLPAALGPDVYWGAQVIVNLFARHSVHRPGPGAADPWRLRGGRRHAEPLLQLPRDRRAAGAAGLVVAHLLALHDVGSNNPDGIEIKGRPKDNRWSSQCWTASRSTRTTRSMTSSGVCVFLMVFFGAIVFFAPEFGGYFLEYNNFIPADPWSHRCTSRRSGTSRRSIRCCAHHRPR